MLYMPFQIWNYSFICCFLIYDRTPLCAHKAFLKLTSEYQRHFTWQFPQLRLPHFWQILSTQNADKTTNNQEQDMDGE